MVKTSILRNQTAWETGTAPRTAFTSIGTRGKNGHSSTSDIDNSGVEYFTLVQKEGVGCWDTHKPYHRSNIAVVERNNVTLGFPNDLKLDAEKENIWVVSNNLPVYLYSELDYSQVNFRLMRANVKKIKGTICDPQTPASRDTYDQCSY